MKNGVFIFVLYLIFAAYLINNTFTFIPIPESVSSFENWIFLAAGLLLILGGFKFLKRAA